jgi:hypothetical protein
MTIFEYVTVAISIILGLAMARLLSSVSDLIVFRKSITFHWIPLVWAASLFCLIFLFWWNLFAVSQILEIWTILDFALAIGVALAFFLASSLLLPKHWSEERLDLFEFFRDQGKWGVGAYAGVFLITIPLNYQLYGAQLFSTDNWFDAFNALTAVATVLSRSKLQSGAWTAVFISILIVNLLRIIYPAF